MVPAAFLIAAHLRYPAWGNDRLGDCLEAAVANVVLADTGQRLSYSAVIHAFYDLGPTTVQAGWEQWTTAGIAGSMAMSVPPVHSLLDAERDIAHRHALIAEYWAPGHFAHAAAVVGYNRKGFVLATWGEKIEMTWWHWESAGIGLFQPIL